MIKRGTREIRTIPATGRMSIAFGISFATVRGG